MARIIITGGSGGVATSVRPHLAAAGHEVVLLDVVEPPVALEPTEAFQIFDATDLPGSIAAFHGADLVVHLAAHASERTWQQIPSSTFRAPTSSTRPLASRQFRES